MTGEKGQPGVSAMSVYVPRFRVGLEDWCEWTGNSWEKVRTVVGHGFRVCGEHENVYTMAANAVLRLIRRNGVDPRQIGFLGFGTESSTDNSAGAVIIRGMVDRALDQLDLPRLSRNLEVPEFKHACLGGIYALKGALRYLAVDGAGRQAIVVSADVAKYERGSSGEQTQGAGAVAMLTEGRARLFEVNLSHAGSASAYRGPDFRKPFPQRWANGNGERAGRSPDFPIFSGRYSTYAYIDETAHAVEEMLRRMGVSAGRYYRSVRGLFFHRPYHRMPVQAMSFLYVRGMARGDHHHDELRELCAEAGVSYDEVIEESRSAPDLFAGVLLSGAKLSDPYGATSQAANALRNHASFRELLQQKMSLGSDTLMNLGNLYSAALPAWIAAAFEEALGSGSELGGAPMVAVGYGSGDAAEAIPIRVVDGWQEAAGRIGFAEALADPIDLKREQYEALHDGEEVPDLKYAPRQEFIISHVGDRYERTFQDLGVEYYEYVT
jgi:hydroxymethylglutaryl-CoA synthase